LEETRFYNTNIITQRLEHLHSPEIIDFFANGEDKLRHPAPGGY